MRLLVLSFLLLAIGLLAARRTGAQQSLPDNVEEFRRALRLEKSKISSVFFREDKRTKSILEFRKKNLAEKAAALKSLGEVSQALLLQDWELPADAEIRNKLVDRLSKGLQDLLASGDSRELIAATGLIRETAASARKQVPQQRDVGEKLIDLAPELAKLADNSNSEVRVGVAAALSQVLPPAKTVVPPLQKLLGDSEVGVRRAAALAFSDMLKTLLEQFSSVGSTAELLVAPPKLEGKEKDRPLFDREVRSRSREQFRSLGVQAIKVLTNQSGAGLADTDDTVRRWSIQACLSTGRGLRALVPDSDPSLFPPPGRVPSPEEEKFIEEQRRNAQEDFDYAKPLFEAAREAAPALGRAVADSNRDVRLDARRTLEELAGARQRMRRVFENLPPAPKGGKPLGRLRVLDPRALLVCASGRPLEELVRWNQEEEKVDPLLQEPTDTLNALVEGLTDCDLEVRLAAVNAIEAMYTEAAPAIPALVRALEDHNRFVRWALVRILGKLAPRQAELVVPALIPLLVKDKEIEVRVAAAVALEHFGPDARPALRALIEVVVSSDAELSIAAMRALAAIGPEAAVAVPEIAKNLRVENARVRRTAAEILLRFGPLAIEAAPALRCSLDDPDPDVRKAVSEALIRVLGR